MVQFTGYTKRPEPKWPYIAIIIVAILLLFALSSFIGWFNSTLSKIKVEADKKAVLATFEAKAIEKEPSTAEVKSGTIKLQTPITSTNPEITLEVMVFATSMNDYNQPNNDVSTFSKSSGSRLYCYTRISALNRPQTMRHVWIDPNGNETANIKMDIVNRPSNIWSYINPYEKKPGTWTVQIKTLNGAIIGEKKIKIEE